MRGLLDPKRINGPEYFGNTKFRGGKMAGFVKDDLSAISRPTEEELAKVIVALSAEAKLPAQQQLDAKDAKASQEGRKLIAGRQCTTVTSSTTRENWATPPS